MDIKVTPHYYNNKDFHIHCGAYKAMGSIVPRDGVYSFSISEKLPDDSWQYILTVKEEDFLDAIDEVVRILIEYQTVANEIQNANRQKTNYRPPI